MQTKIIQLKRSYLKNCTIGEFFFEGKRICFSVEKPWLSNKPRESCIPPGVYDIDPYSSSKYPTAFVLSNPNLGVSLNGQTTRTYILIHVANYPDQVLGCIGPGMGLQDRVWGVSRSGDAMEMLNELIDFNDGQKWQLDIAV